MRTASESPITLSGKPLIAFQQGTMHFMSIEVAAQEFLFLPRPRLTTANLRQRGHQDVISAPAGQTEVPFSHNHLHDLESLWWVAVWILFYNHFSKEETSSRSVTLHDAEQRLRLAQTLFPPVRGSDTCRDGFQTVFQKKYYKLPEDNRPFGANLDVIRQLLITQYNDVEANLPESIDPDSSDDEIYNGFKMIFSELKSDSDGLKLEYLPKIYKELSKEENPKHPWSGSTNDAEGATVLRRL
jgi:hypothetical protein